MKKFQIKDMSNPLKSIRGKLITLGSISIISTVILGITGIQLMNRNNSNNKVLNDMNNINLLQHENEAQEVNFLYYLEETYYDSILGNLNSMKTFSDDSLKYSNHNFKKDLSVISDDISASLTNTDELMTLISERGFLEENGMYQDFLSKDGELQECFNVLASESDWIDCAWADTNLSSLETVEIDGKEYKHATYTTDLKDVSKRNYLVARVGNNGIDYTGNVYVSNFVFDNKDTVDLSAVTVDDLSNSYGDGLSALNVTTFDGNPAITFTGKFSEDNENWQEASIEIPIPDYNIQNYKKLSYDLYFEATQTPLVKIAAAFNEKYDFAGGLDAVNAAFGEYSKLVAEGKDIEDSAAQLTALLTELTDNLSLYSLDEDTSGKAANLSKEKMGFFEQIHTFDQDILKLRTENIALNSSLTEATTNVRESIDAATQSSRISMTILISVVFVIGAALVIALSLFTITSIQKSVTTFRDTLDSIAAGDMTVRAQTGSGGEFDLFGKALNHTLDKLTTTLSSVLTIAEDIKISGSSLKEMAENTNGTSSQIDMSISGISQGATDQAKDVEQSTTQISDLGNLMDKMVANIGVLDSNSMEMKAASDDAEAILDELSVSNAKTTSEIQKVADQINTTNVSVSDIAAAVSLISSIAEETNLLALNASIEAARAGEAGKGFAVVATEIQQLADQSNNSANTITQIIQNLTSEFKVMLQIMDEVNAATTEQNEKLSQTQQRFVTVKDGIVDSRQKTADIKMSIEECNALRQSISEIMLNLSAISEENAASTYETAEAMQTLNETIAHQLDESNKLQDISIKLENDMQFFRL